MQQITYRNAAFARLNKEVQRPMKRQTTIKSIAARFAQICEAIELYDIMVIYPWEWLEYEQKVEASEGACVEALC